MSRNFDEMDLKEVLLLAKAKDELAIRYLVTRYKSLINTIINTEQYYLPYGQREDLISEGLFALSRAIDDFDEAKGNSSNFQKNLENFFYMCINRALISAIKGANRLKHRPLNNMITLDSPLQDNENLTKMDVIAFRPEIQDSTSVDFMNPESRLTLQETLDRVQSQLGKHLSESERDIYLLRRQKFTYCEIKNELKYPKTKTIDNALQRVKIKMLKILEQEERKAQNLN